jgi:hypothetical protein
MPANGSPPAGPANAGMNMLVLSGGGGMTTKPVRIATARGGDRDDRDDRMRRAGSEVWVLRDERDMRLTNDSYVILIGTKNFTERYYRDKDGWLKISARGRKFRMTAEQVLNHLLPALAGVETNLIIKVEHRSEKRAIEL